jgi:hypothetical protein
MYQNLFLGHGESLLVRPTRLVKIALQGPRTTSLGLGQSRTICRPVQKQISQ